MKNMEEKQVRGPHKLVINNRQTSLVTGVLDVLSFDLNEVLLETEQGMLMVKGMSPDGVSMYIKEISSTFRLPSAVNEVSV